MPDRKALEALWRQRLNDAKLRLEFAANYVKELQRNSGDAPDGAFAFQEALSAEKTALHEYGRVLGIFTDLVVYGKVPDERAAGVPPMDD